MIRLGCIGIARRGSMLYNLRPDDEAVKLVAVADNNPESIAEFQSQNPGLDFFATTDYRELLARRDVDAVSIICRDFLHEEMAVAALEAGKIVFLEKPMAITIEGCDRILRTAKRTGSKLFVGHNMRYMDYVIKMHEVVSSGRIGQLQAVWMRHFVNYGSCYFRHWCAERRNCTGLLLQKGAHDIDVICHIAGAPVAAISGMGKLSVYNRCQNRLKPGEAPDRKISFTQPCWPPLELKGLSPNIDIEDHSMIMMQLANGVQAAYLQCMYAPDNRRNYTFIGDRGRVETDGGSEVWVYTDRSNTPTETIQCISPSDNHGGADPKIVKAFYDFAEGREVTIPSPADARNAVAAGVTGHQSMRNGGGLLAVPPLDPELAAYFNGGQR